METSTIPSIQGRIKFLPLKKMIFASVGSQAECITGYSAGQGGKIYIHWRHGDRVLLILEISGGNQPHTSCRLAAVNSEQPPRSSLERSSETFNI